MNVICKRLFVFISAMIFLLFPYDVFAVTNNVYDVILFWGQSNMVGSCGGHTCTDGKIGEESEDARLVSLGASEFSKQSGIDLEIVNLYTTMGHVNVPVISGTVYEYLYNSNTLVEITKDTKYFGETLYTNSDSSGNVVFNATNNEDNVFAIQRSQGTNMAVWFAKTYYEKTGHKVIIVMAANGGEQIRHFLLHSSSDSNTTTTDKQYIYEAMVAKYKAAIDYLNSKSMKIGNQFHIVFQGEADVSSAQSTGEVQWQEIYEYIHSLLKKNLGMQFGVIVETAYTVGLDKYNGAYLVNTSQEKTISSNSDVLLGSSYPWDRYVPNEEMYYYYDSAKLGYGYNGKYLGATKSYADALEQAKLSVSISQCSENTIHFHSAALSQIGLESATNVFNFLKVNGYLETENEDDNVSGNLFRTFKINGEDFDLNDTDTTYNYMVSSDVDKVTIEAVLDDDSLSFEQNFGPRTVSLEYGSNEIELKVVVQENDIRTYKINVVRQENSDGVVNDEVVKNPATGSFVFSLLFILMLSFFMVLYFYKEKFMFKDKNKE